MWDGQGSFCNSIANTGFAMPSGKGTRVQWRPSETWNAIPNASTASDAISARVHTDLTLIVTSLQRGFAEHHPTMESSMSTTKPFHEPHLALNRIYTKRGDKGET